MCTTGSSRTEVVCCSKPAHTQNIITFVKLLALGGKPLDGEGKKNKLKENGPLRDCSLKGSH